MGLNDVVAAILQRRIPKLLALRRGDFGEVLASDELHQFEDYLIPVRKLRYKVTADQSLTGTDCLAIRLDGNGAISEMCFVESKLRCRRDAAAGVEACTQLLRDTAASVPDILLFVLARLKEMNSPLYQPFRRYLAARADTSNMETLRVVLHWDSDAWSENVLTNIEEANLEAPNLTVNACLIPGLAALVDRTYQRLGLTATDEDD